MCLLLKEENFALNFMICFTRVSTDSLSAVEKLRVIKLYTIAKMETVIWTLFNSDSPLSGLQRVTLLYPK